MSLRNQPPLTSDNLADVLRVVGQSAKDMGVRANKYDIREGFQATKMTIVRNTFGGTPANQSVKNIHDTRMELMGDFHQNTEHITDNKKARVIAMRSDFDGNEYMVTKFSRMPDGRTITTTQNPKSNVIELFIKHPTLKYTG